MITTKLLQLKTMRLAPGAAFAPAVVLISTTATATILFNIATTIIVSSLLWCECDAFILAPIIPTSVETVILSEATTTTTTPPTRADARTGQQLFDRKNSGAITIIATPGGVSSSRSSTSMSDHIFAWMNHPRKEFTRETRPVWAGTSWLVPSAYAVADLARELPATTTSSPTTTGPPTQDEIQLLQDALGAMYGAPRDPTIALPLLDQAILAFARQAPDERAGLYRVRAECYMAVQQPTQAMADYTAAIALLQGPEAQRTADGAELPAAYLGRARAVRSLGTKAITKGQATQCVMDYRQALILSSKDDGETVEETIEEGIRSNPYAAWEYGMALRHNAQYDEAQAIHLVTSATFDAISDRSRAVISLLDAGIDAACTTNNNNKEDTAAKDLLQKGIQSTTTSESRDVALLQRVVAKEGEGRIVLAALEWTNTGGDNSLRGAAEQEITTTCERMNQLEQDALQRLEKTTTTKNNNQGRSGRGNSGARTTVSALRFNIDDYPGALETSCSRIQKNQAFQTERLEWPISLQEKVQKLSMLK